MTRIVLVQAVLGHSDGLAADAVVNDFTFIVPDNQPVSEAANLIMENLVKGFYNGVNGGAQPLNTFLSLSISRLANKCQLRFYDITDHLDGSRHGSPYRTHSWQMGGNPTNAMLPAEIAIALSFKAAYGSQSEFGPGIGPGGGPLRPRARRRGRLYVGPLQQTVLSAEGTTNRQKVNTTVQTQLCNCAKVLMDVPDIEWAVWSRTDGNALKVVEAWVDDAFDVQRRRGEKPLSRMTVVAA